ncbi:MAG: sugar transferase [Thermomicrobiales bacterium]
MTSPAQQEDAEAWLTYLDVASEVSVFRVIYVAWIKRAADIAGSLMLLAILSPLLLLIILAIRLESRGNVIFRQERVGRDGGIFTIYKFRTMIPDRRTRQKPFLGKERRKHHKTRKDPRVTKTGAFLRRTSLDELPQIVNVLKGEMSFIGPRPELPSIVARYEPWQHERHLVRPGLSGWWQVTGRSDRPMHENTELDIYYVQNCSFMLDLRIFFRTFGALIGRRGAF